MSPQPAEPFSPARALAEIDRQLADSPEGLCAVVLVRILGRRDIDLLFGFTTGEQLEAAARERIAAALRPVDHVLPMGAGRFALVLPKLLAPNHALLAAQRLVRAFRAPLELAHTRILATVAVGAAVAPEHGEDADALLRAADIACEAAQGRSERIALYDHRRPPLDVSYDELERAVHGGDMRVFLQPMLDLRDGRVAGAESLARWQNPRVGWVRPDLFVAMAEQTGLIGELTRWSLNATLRHAAEAGLGERGLRFSVNLSPTSLHEPDIADQLLDALRLWNLPTACLGLEVTEGAILRDPEHATSVLAHLAGEGVRVSIDDFGTGHSAFAWLRHLPAHELKIDRSFITDLTRDERAARVVQSIIELGHHLGMEVVAEGVADADTRARLAAMGCDLAQGFHLGRPEAAEHFVERLVAAPAG